MEAAMAFKLANLISFSSRAKRLLNGVGSLSGTSLLARNWEKKCMRKQQISLKLFVHFKF